MSVHTYEYFVKWGKNNMYTRIYIYTHSMWIACCHFCKKRKWQEHVFVFTMSAERNAGGDFDAESGGLGVVRVSGEPRDRE